MIRENLKRFWAIPVFGFLGYFFAGVFPLLMYDDRYHYMRTILEIRNPAYVIFCCLFPLIASIVLQRYMFAPGSAAVIHSMPFTRTKLFNSNFVSGLLLIWTPIVIVGVLCLIMNALSPFSSTMYLDSGDIVHTIPASGILYGHALMLITSLFVYIVCILAGVVCGNTAMHIIVSGLLSVILPSLILIGYVYCENFLFGFRESPELSDFAAALSPVSYFTANGGEPGAAVWAYILAAIILYAAANVLYAKKPLEKAGDSLTFTFMEWIFCFFAALAGMTLMAFYFASFSSWNWGREGVDELRFYAGMAVGAIVAFALARIIVKKSPRIWNRETGIQFGVFTIAVLLLFLGLRLDLFGYERRVPEVSALESVSLNIPTAGGTSKMVQNFIDSDFYVFSDAANIEAVTAFHRRVAENREALRYSKSYSTVAVRYIRSGFGMPMSRMWNLPVDFCAEDEHLRSLVESDEFREQNSLSNPRLGKIEHIALAAPLVDLNIVLSSDEFKGITEAVNSDLRLLTYEQLFDLTSPIATIEIESTATEDQGRGIFSRWVTLGISAEFKHTLAWLSERGYYQRLTAWRDSVESVRLTHREENNESDEDYSPYTPSGDMPEVEVGVFRDPKMIRAALEQYEVSPRYESDYYVLYFTIPPYDYGGLTGEPAESDTDIGGEPAEPDTDIGGEPAESDTAIGGEPSEPPAATSEPIPYLEQIEFDNSYLGGYYGEHQYYLNPGNPALDILLKAEQD
jgi:ABC-2 type transport system permease protein